MTDHIETIRGYVSMLAPGPYYHPVIDALVALEVELQRLRTVIGECAAQFRDYERQHLAKSPPDMIKAATNEVFARMCEKSI